MEEKVFFENSKGNRLCGIFSDSKNTKKAQIVILCHGFLSSKDGRTCKNLQTALNRSNTSTFCFDFFGHGESEGKIEDITISEAADDIICAISFVKSRGFSSIGLFGSSFGGLASIIAASKERSLSVIALRSPVSSFEDIYRSQKYLLLFGTDAIVRWKENGYLEHGFFSGGKKIRINYSFYEDSLKNNGYTAASKINIPVLIVHGDRDGIVPVEQSKKTAANLRKGRLEIIPGAGHEYRKEEDFEKMINLVTGFIIENI